MEEHITASSRHFWVPLVIMDETKPSILQDSLTRRMRIPESGMTCHGMMRRTPNTHMVCRGIQQNN